MSNQSTDERTYKALYEEERRKRWAAEKKLTDIVSALEALGFEARKA